MNTTAHSSISPHKPGGTKEAFFVTLPLMITALSGNLMMFFDRLILAHYSIDAMNAVSIAATAIIIYQYVLWAIVNVAEIIISESYGANKKKELASPVWQMIWLSLASLVIVIPVSLYTGNIIIPENYQSLGLSYYQYMVYSVPFIGVTTALSSFFVGQGKIKFVFISALTANVVNIFFDIIFIFGIKSVIPAMGAKGAALSGLLSLTCEAAILLAAFLSKRNSVSFYTRKLSLNLKMIIYCIKNGAPTSIGHTIEISAWLVLMLMMAKVSQLDMTILAIGNSIYLLFSFVTDGVSRGAMVIFANLRASKNIKLIKKSLMSSCFIVILMMSLLAIPLIFFPQSIHYIFVSSSDTAQFKNTIYQALKINLIGLWLFLILDGLMWVFSSILIAYRDSFINMLIISITIWVFGIIPMYFLFVFEHASANLIWLCFSAYAGINLLFTVFRANTIIKRSTTNPSS